MLGILNPLKLIFSDFHSSKYCLSKTRQSCSSMNDVGNEPRDLRHDLKRARNLQLVLIFDDTPTLLRCHISLQLRISRSYFTFTLIVWELLI